LPQQWRHLNLEQDPELDLNKEQNLKGLQR
jgi:hypothetical protein